MLKIFFGAEILSATIILSILYKRVFSFLKYKKQAVLFFWLDF